MRPQLKQLNKKHKSGEKSKRQQKSEQKGKMNRILKPHSKVKMSNKMIRREQRKNKIKKQISDTAVDHAKYGGPSGAPILCIVVPLDTAVSPWMIRSLFKSCVEDESWIDAKVGGSFHFTMPQFRKRLSLRLSSYSNMFMAMDLAKVADFVIFASKSVESLERDEYGLALLASMYGQGLSRCAYVTMGDSSQLSDLRRFVESKYPVEKNQFWSIDKKSSAQQLLRHICQTLPNKVTYRDWRSYMLCEEVTHHGSSENGPWLEVAGHIRGQPFDVNSRVHVTGWGDFAVAEVARSVDPIPPPNRKKPDPLDEAGAVIARPAACDGEDVQMEQDKDEVEDDDDSESEMDDDSEGDSDFDTAQSDFDAESGVGEEEEMEEDAADPKQDAELARFRRAREEAEFPDEVDTPLDVPARKRFARYRSLASLREHWDVDSENVPQECRELLSFTNLRHFRNRVRRVVSETEKEAELGVGRFIKLHLRPLRGSCLDGFVDRRLPTHPLVLFSLLPAEDKRSMLHVSLRSHFPQSRFADEEEEEEEVAVDLSRFDTDDLGEFRPETRLEQRRAAERAPIRSKDPMLFQVGFRRCAARPIFSDDSRGDWHKFRRFVNPAEPVMASMVGPVVLPPCPVLMFRGACREVLLATGIVAACDPRRRCLKRVVLSGHPFKVRAASAVVRYMFFNPDDVDFFKTMELRTKTGRRGRIVESLGTHGLMKCRFDRHLSQLDVVMLPLYKPVYPKGVAEDVPLGRLREPSYRRT